MKAEELVGKWIESEILAAGQRMPADTAFKVVGFTLDENWAIVDAGLIGWKWLEAGDILIEKCETYWYVPTEDITKVRP